MRLKQLLRIICRQCTAMAAATVSQLGGVLVKNQDSAAVITILANGTFTHTEYRPTDNLMLVDLAGVSTANQDAKVHEVAAPGVRSYRITGYRSANGAEVARMELTLARDAKVNVAEVEGGLELRVSGWPAVAARSDLATASPIQKTVAATRIREISVAPGRRCVEYRDQWQRPDDGQDHEADAPRPRCRRHSELCPSRKGTRDSS